VNILLSKAALHSQEPLMTKVAALLNERLKKSEGPSKMAAMATQSVNGNLSSFSGVFSLAELNDQEKANLEELLRKFASPGSKIEADLQALSNLTSEVKAITNQAAYLHGERVKRAHALLAKYRDGAFTAWLYAAYGNRQTPYNFWQYYEFCELLPRQLRQKIETMPRQAIYTLASREGELEKKVRIIHEYNGETKAAVLLKIRELFPLAEEDKRVPSRSEQLVTAFEKAAVDLLNTRKKLNESELDRVKHFIDKLNEQYF